MATRELSVTTSKSCILVELEVYSGMLCFEHILGYQFTLQQTPCTYDSTSIQLICDQVQLLMDKIFTSLTFKFAYNENWATNSKPNS